MSVLNPEWQPRVALNIKCLWLSAVWGLITFSVDVVIGREKRHTTCNNLCYLYQSFSSGTIPVWAPWW